MMKFKDERGALNLKRSSDSKKVFDGNVSFASLYSANVCAVKTGQT